MTDIAVKCPQCRAKLRASESNVGKKIKCPKCATIFVLARPESSSDSAPVSAVPPELAAKKQRPCGADGIARDWEPGDLILELYEVIKLPGTKHGYAEGALPGGLSRKLQSVRFAEHLSREG